MSSHITSPYLEKEEPDQYGQTHPIESDRLLNTSLNLMDEELEKLSTDLKEDLFKAHEKCPQISNSDKHKLMFLRCEQFNADMAAKRIAKYWSRRIELFGPHAFSDLTLEQTQDDGVALRSKFIQILPSTDKKGRAIAFIQPRSLSSLSKDCGKDDDSKNTFTRESMVRVIWFMIHAVLEDNGGGIAAQQKGLVFIIDLSGTKVKHFDIPFVKQCAESIRGIIPVRVSAMHFCQPPVIFDVFAEVVKLVFGERLRKRIIVHSQWWEKRDDVATLGCYGFEKNQLPTDIGGDTVLDHESWLEKRRSMHK